MTRLNMAGLPSMVMAYCCHAGAQLCPSLDPARPESGFGSHSCLTPPQA